MIRIGIHNCLSLRSLFTFYVLCSERKNAGKDAKAGKLDVTNSGNGERATGNGEPGTGVWELMYSGNPLENSKWRTKQKKMLEETIWVNASFYRLCPLIASTFL